MARQIINNGDSGLVTRNKINENDQELYERILKEQTFTPAIVFDADEKYFNQFAQSGALVISLDSNTNGQASYIYTSIITDSNSITFPSEWIEIKNEYVNDFGEYGLVVFFDGINYQYQLYFIQIEIPIPDILSFDDTGLNTYVDITFNTGVYADVGATLPLLLADLQITNFVASGATALSISSIEKPTGGALVGGETSIRCNLSITGSADGTETFQIQPIDGSSVYNLEGEVMLSTATTGTVTLNILSISLVAQRTGLATAPTGIAIDNANGKMYILEQTSTTLRKIDIATFTEDDTLTLSGNGRGLLIDTDNNRLFCTTADNFVVEINLVSFTQTIARSVTGVAAPMAMALASDGKFYVSDISFNIIEVFTDYTLGTSDRTIAYTAVAFQMQFDGADLYISNSTSDKVDIIDTASADALTNLLDSTDLLQENRGALVDLTNNKVITERANPGGPNRILIFDKVSPGAALEINVNGTGQLRQIAQYQANNRYFICNTGDNEIIEISY